MTKSEKILKKIMHLADKYKKETTKLGSTFQSISFDGRKVNASIRANETEIHVFGNKVLTYMFIDEHDVFREVKADDIDYVQNLRTDKDKDGYIAIIRRLYLKNGCYFDFRTTDETGFYDAYLK